VDSGPAKRTTQTDKTSTSADTTIEGTELMNKNRHARRALLARLRCSISKGHAFGRVTVLAHEEGPTGQDCRVVYQHRARGVLDRRTTPVLLGKLAEALA
jgi:hypothetical protein